MLLICDVVAVAVVVVVILNRTRSARCASCADGAIMEAHHGCVSCEACYIVKMLYIYDLCDSFRAFADKRKPH